jgi:glutamate synthase domain-containing protein 3
MSGGIAYVYDDRSDFALKRCNLASVDLFPVVDKSEIAKLRELVSRHAQLTQSPRAKWLLENWPELLSRFIKVFPHELQRALKTTAPIHAHLPLESPQIAVGATHG